MMTGYSHSAFSFAYESLVVRSSVAQTDLPPGTLIGLLQKGLEYMSIEENINEVRLWSFLKLLYCSLTIFNSGWFS